MIPEWNSFINADCMEYLKEFPDNYFDLAIVDPPYGDGLHAEQGGGKGWFAKYNQKITIGADKNITWDIAPSDEYFEQLFRVSKNQIIWGGNYFYLPPTRCFIIWEKTNIPENFTMSMCEYAWTSFNANAKIYKHTSLRDKTSGKFHPTEKPIDLYEWLLQQYAKNGETILDTHVGSASSLIACRKTNHKYIGFEIDETYYQQAKKRLDAETAQVNVFDLI